MVVFPGPGLAQRRTRATEPGPDIHWFDYYRQHPLDDTHILPKPFPKVRYWSTKWKRDNPNPKTAEGFQAMYGMGLGGGLYPGMMNPMMLGGMGGYGGGMTHPMMGGYGVPRYPGGMYGGMGYGGYGGYGAYPGMYDPYMGYGAPPAANAVDDNADAHRIEHAYRQSMPDSYGIGMSSLPGPMGINTMAGAPMLLYGRGMGYGGGGWYA